jgi:hypothetical protein
MRSMTLVLTLGLLAACSKSGGGIVATAESAAEKACACSDFDCAKAAVSDFNRASIQADDEKAALDADARARFDAAVQKMSTCRDDLRN